jgi:lipopolysaccharide biosynthesis protein
MKGSKLKIIAFYLPQFHPFPENDKWWGKGFTEWTNVGKAKPLFKGHNQPRVPTELGYYDLRLPIVREQQAELAREAGVTAFCYWHYWFGKGKRLIPEVFDEVLTSGKPDFPFCLGWANHSWYAKNWNADGSITQQLLMEQTYPGIEDEKMHFQYLIKAFKDPRYVKIDNCPFFHIFDPDSLPQEYLDNFRKWTKEAGFKDLFLVAKIFSNQKPQDYLDKGYSAVTIQRLAGANKNSIFSSSRVGRRLYKEICKVRGILFRRPPFMYDYRKEYHNLIQEIDKDENVIPAILPQWDHTPRSGWNGSLFVNSTPHYFGEHVKEALNAIKEKSSEKQILLLKSWNEWGEGNYMEPDMLYGRGFINALREQVDKFKAIGKTA